MGLKLQNAQVSQLGRARRVVVSKDATTIIDGAGASEEIKGRIKQIKAEIETTDSDFDREKLQERLAKLAGGVAVVKVGAATETEMKERKHRVEDALQATRAALEEGIVPGGGVVLINSIPALEALKLEGDEATGAAIVRRALEEPLRQLAENAGLEGSVVVGEVKAKKVGVGLDVESGRVRRPGQGRHHRPGHGHPLGPPERLLASPRTSSPPRRWWPTSPRRTPARPAWAAWAAWGWTCNSAAPNSSSHRGGPIEGPLRRSG